MASSTRSRSNGDAASGDPGTLDPDALAALERERDFLLRSLDDLDAEHNAGDLDEVDHGGLSDDYTRRLAEVQRSITERRQAFVDADTRLNNKQRVLTVLGIVVVAVLAGVFLARASGFRSPTDSVTGDIRQSSAGLLAEADTLTREGRWEEARDVYQDVLEISPANVEALTYRGWLSSRLGDNEAALGDLTEALAVDPDFVDARVFTAIVYDNELRFAEAAEQLEAFDALDPPDEMLGLVASFNLRASVTAGQVKQTFDPLGPGETIDLEQVIGSHDDLAAGGALLSQVGDAVLAQAVFDAILEQDSDHLVSLVGKGQLAREPAFWQFDDTTTATESLAALDRAVELSADLPEASVVALYQADALFAKGDVEPARTALASVDPAALSPDLVALYDDLNVRLN